MSLKLGKMAVRRTKQYLERDPLMLQNDIKVLMFSYITPQSPFQFRTQVSSGLYKFIYWNIPQIMYRNINVQFSFFHDKSKTPYIEAFFDERESVIMDCFDKNHKDISQHFRKVFGKTEQFIKHERAKMFDVDNNPAHFGYDYKRHCACELSDQWPCSKYVTIPKTMRGKEILKAKLENEAK